MALASVGCTQKEAPKPAVGDTQVVAQAENVEEPNQTFHYSPFVVEVSGSDDFDAISFKDVGILRMDYTPADPKLETLAEAVAYEMSVAHPGLELAVKYDPKMADPANHKACAGRHVYVDVWQTAHQHYGYSLWSGCGEDDNFAWEQLSTPIEDHADLVQEVTPLARALSEKLKHASQTKCFQKNC